MVEISLKKKKNADAFTESSSGRNLLASKTVANIITLLIVEKDDIKMATSRPHQEVGR